MLVRMVISYRPVFLVELFSLPLHAVYEIFHSRVWHLQRLLKTVQKCQRIRLAALFLDLHRRMLQFSETKVNNKNNKIVENIMDYKEKLNYM